MAEDIVGQLDRQSELRIKPEICGLVQIKIDLLGKINVWLLSFVLGLFKVKKTPLGLAIL